MNCCAILGLREDLLASAEEAALLVLEECWRSERCPTAPPELLKVLKNTLDRCTAKGITYPRAFLLRKGQLARGDWKPAQAQPNGRAWTPPAGACQKCGGTGIVVRPGGMTGTLCGCGAGRKG